MKKIQVMLMVMLVSTVLFAQKQSMMLMQNQGT